MNERIRELTVKALSSCNPAKMTSLSNSVDNGDGVDIPLEFSEKFAQLIVQECMQLNRDILCEDDPNYLDQIYREHFGVE